MFIASGTPLFSLPVFVALSLVGLTPVIFGACLYSAHRVMRAAKEGLLSQVNQVFERSYGSLRTSIARGEVNRPEAEEILHLENLHSFLRRLPVWPTHLQIMTQVFMSVAVPLAMLCVQIAVERAVDSRDLGAPAPDPNYSARPALTTERPLSRGVVP